MITPPIEPSRDVPIVISPAIRLPSDQQPIHIVWNSSGTHAFVSRQKTEGRKNGLSYTLLPGESYYGIPYEEWAAAAGDTIDVLQRQWRSQAARERLTRPRGIAAKVSGDSWRTEPDPGALEKPSADYGFSNGVAAVPCSQEQLVRQCVEVPETPAVWSPEGAGWTCPEEVSFLVEAVAEVRQKSTAAQASLAGAVILAAFYLALATSQASTATSFLLMGAFGATWLAAAVSENVRVQRAGSEVFREARQQHLYSIWITSKKSGATGLLILLVAVVAVLGLFDTSAAIEVAGLKKELVRDGEAWRLLTGVFIHGGLLHLLLNLLGLWGLGPVVEAHGGRGTLPILFILSALGGSALSLYLLPVQTSVGASGGILGLAGYLFAMAYRKPGIMPAGFYRLLHLGIVATAMFGVVAYRYVDNATHLGGFLAGILLTWWLPPLHPGTSKVGHRLLPVLASLAWVILVAASIGTGFLIYEAITASSG